ncbi:hypothetical protein DMENIID0001_033950 [Sergentomyia squamirostris]
MVEAIPSKTILILNDDCFLHIYSFLEHEDVLNMEMVCTRLEEVTNRFYRTYRVMDLDDGTWWRKLFKQLAPKVAEYVQNLKVVRSATINIRGRNVKPLLCLFTNLEHLHIEEFKKMMEYSHVMTTLFVKLKTAVLVNCDLTDEIGTWISGATQLQVLDVAANHELTGDFLLLLHNLKELSINSCDGIEARYFLQFCENNCTLKRLDVFYWYNLTQECVDAIAHYLKNTEILLIGHGDFNGYTMTFDALGDLPNLKNLSFAYFGYNEIKDACTFVDLLANHNHLEYLHIEIDPCKRALRALTKFDKLKKLVLFCEWVFIDEILQALQCKHVLEDVNLQATNVSNQGAISLIKSCPNLRKINLTCCKFITGKLLKDLRRHIKERSQPLKITLQYTDIDWNTVYDLGLQNNDMLDFNFNTDSELERTKEDYEDITDPEYGNDSD